MSTKPIPVYLVQLGRNCLPLSLGMIEATLRTERAAALRDRFVFERLVSPKPAQIDACPPGIWLFSDYMWSIEFNAFVSRAARARHAGNVLVHGGPSVPKRAEACEAFFAARDDVDVAVRGEGEATALELLAHLAGTFDGPDWRDGLDAVSGLSFRESPGGRVVRTAERPRLQDLDALPSPYLEGIFEDWLRPKVGMATVETNRGCPYACTFCDWGSATQQKIHAFDAGRVEEEIEWIARHEIPVLFIADANFGILERDLRIAEHVARMRRRHGHPKEVMVSYAKNGNERIAEMVRVMAKGDVVTTGVISIQSLDPGILRAVRRTNIRTQNYEKLVGVFREQGLPVAVDLMVGLPGSTLATHKADLQWCIDEDLVGRTFPTFVLPNSPMAEPEYLREHGIATRDGVLTATATASEAELGEVWDLCRLYEIAEKSTLLRYVLRYLQWQHGLPAAELLHALARDVRRRPERYPHALRALDRSACMHGVLHDPAPFYASIWRTVRDDLGVALGSELDQAIWRLNMAVVPRRGARYPIVVESPWDLLGYFASCRSPRGGEVRAVRAVDPPQRFTISDPEGYARGDDGRAVVNVNSGLRVFELDWPVKQRGVVAAMYGDEAHAWRAGASLEQAARAGAPIPRPAPGDA